MVIRDRLIALIYRILAFLLGVLTLQANVSANAINGIMNSFANYSTLVTLFGVIVLLSEIIANIVGMKGNRRTLAPGIVSFIFHAALVLEIGLALCHPLYCHFIASAYFKVDILPYVLLTYVFFPFSMLLDWILFGEKGTVRWSYGMFPLFFPVFYYLFSIMWHLATNSTTYAVQVFNPDTFAMSSNLPSVFKNGDGWAGVGLSCLMLLSIIAAIDYLLIFINNLMAGRYRKETSL